MDTGKIIIKCLLGLWICISPNNLTGQIKNQYDVHLKYSSVKIISPNERTFNDKEYGIELPRILGNLDKNYNCQFGLLYSGASYIFQPAFIFTFTNYTGNKSLMEMYNDFHIKSYAVGLGCKINFWAYGHHLITPYAQVYANIAWSEIENKTDTFNVQNKADNSDVTYNLALLYSFEKSHFINPNFDVSLGAELRFGDRLLLFAETGINLKKYPNLDTESSTLACEMTLSIGLRYKLLKDKRYLLR